MSVMGFDTDKSAMIIVDMQNDFLHPDGAFARRARDEPEKKIDMDFLASAIPNVRRLAAAFRKAGRPVVYIAQVLKPDFSDAAFPYWKRWSERKTSFLCEQTWGAQIIDELTPRKGEHLIVKKGYNGFSNTPLDTVLRNLGVGTCVVTGVTTCVCVSSTVRGAVEHNYRVVLVKDAVAEVYREAHEAELRTMARVFGDVKTADEVIRTLASRRRPAAHPMR